MNAYLLTLGVIGLLIGTFTAAGGRSDWPLFWQNPRAQRVVALIGRRAARVFYIALGLALCVAAVGLLMEGLQTP